MLFIENEERQNMWSRAELKTSAKQILQKNYWGAVLVALVLSITLGGTGIGGVISRGGTGNSGTDIDNSVISDGLGNTYSGNYIDVYNDMVQKVTDVINSLSDTTIILIFSLILVILIAAVLISAFVLAPLEIGCRRWLLKNRTNNPPYGEMAGGFHEGYLNIVKIMFCRNLFIGLWSLLFVIPGIVKAYEYRMIPYLLAENPNMSMSEAFRRSKSMMYNNKMNAFVLDWSFIGWHFLVLFTCGLLSIFFVAPYVCLTDTELYVALCQTSGNNQSSYNNSNGQYDSSGEQYNSYHEI